MKTRALLSSIALLLIILGVTITSCNKDDNPTGSTNFSVEFGPGYDLDYGWVVLHNLDGTEVLDYKKITADEVADFGSLNNELVTATFIRVEQANSGNGGMFYAILLSTYYNAPAGKWFFNGMGITEEDMGNADVTIHYPNGNYNNFILSDPTHLYSRSSVTEYGINEVLNVGYLDENNKY